MNFESKVAVVTGARRGIGRAIAVALASAGAAVVVSDIDLPDAEKVAEEIRALGRRSLALKANVSIKSDVQRMMDITVEKFGAINILVNNAGTYVAAPILEQDEESWDRVIDVDLKGVFLCTQAAAKYMIKQGGGKIVNIASFNGMQHGVTIRSAPYSSAKGGVIAFTANAALQLAKYKINVNAVCPGSVLTPMSEGLVSNPEWMASLLKVIPWGRIGQPEDIAKAVLFLASADAEYITGVLLPVDGGLMCGKIW
jgi:NAD(P)-dependent dehydrogenase (short-subunit alcohol dehydrogenase family)